MPLLTPLSAVYDPGQGTLPNGFQGNAQTIVSWVAGGAVLLCLVGVIIAGVKLAHAHRQGVGGPEQIQSLGWTLIGCAVVGAASAVVGVLV